MNHFLGSLGVIGANQNIHLDCLTQVFLEQVSWHILERCHDACIRTQFSLRQAGEGGEEVLAGFSAGVI
jgi:hypothetical protein